MRILKLVTNTALGISKDRYDPERDGISPSLLSRWKHCREKARLNLLGWTSRKTSTAQIFGTIAHAVLEHAYGDIQRGKLGTIPSTKYVKQICTRVEDRWKKDNPRADSDTMENMEMVMLLVEAIMPVYFTFWNRDLIKMDWYHLEQYVGKPEEARPFGKYRSFMKGKMDGAFKTSKDKKGRLWLFETKSKSRLGEHGESNLIDIMPHECQTHLYLGALQDATHKVPGGVLLNIIRRPNFKLKKKESLKQFADRVSSDIQRRPDYYFIRIRMEISARDLEKQRTKLDGMFADFLAWYHGDSPHYHNSDACEDKYGTCEFLKICAKGDTTGMYQRPPRRNELEDR